MREILREIERWQAQGEEIALATLVGVHGSAPRPAGARMCLTRGGRMAGSVSGGCVESDVYAHALDVLDAGRPILRRYGIPEEPGLEAGLSCGGEIDVLIEPFRADSAWRAACESIAARRPAFLAVGLAPDALLGRRLAILPGKSEAAGLQGSIDPDLDAAIGDAARRLSPHAGHALLELPWRGGSSRIFVESLAPQPRLYIVGATHVAIPLCRMARILGFRVIVIDPRSAFATRERFAEADELLREWPNEVLEREPPDAWTCVLTLTHDEKFDIPTLACALRSDARYVGALGSRRTHEKRKARLREQGFTDAELARVHTPIGLDIGARGPEEIALAILAEIVAVHRGRDGLALRTEPA